MKSWLVIYCRNGYRTAQYVAVSCIYMQSHHVAAHDDHFQPHAMFEAGFPRFSFFLSRVGFKSHCPSNKKLFFYAIYKNLANYAIYVMFFEKICTNLSHLVHSDRGGT